MFSKRIIPVLLIRDQSLIKTVKFNKFNYIGDVVNTIKIFNELEVDEIILLDTSISRKQIGPDYELLQKAVSECFVPISYGGGISSLEHAKKLFELGVEKVCLNTFAYKQPELISSISKLYGNQATIGCIDVKKNFFGSYSVKINNAQIDINEGPVSWAKYLQELGAGEILLTSIDREGTWSGFDKNLIDSVSKSVDIPVIAHGGASSLSDIQKLFTETSVSAVGVGSLVLYQSKNMGVLINVPKLT
jgi:cyclase